MRIKKRTAALVLVLVGFVFLASIAYAMKVDFRKPAVVPIHTIPSDTDVNQGVAECGARPASCTGGGCTPGTPCCWQGSNGACTATCNGPDWGPGVWGPEANCGIGSVCTGVGTGGICNNYGGPSTIVTSP